MEVVNPFILKNKERMIVFLDQLSSITDPFMPPGGLLDICNNSSSNNSDTGKISLAFRRRNFIYFLNIQDQNWLRCITSACRTSPNCKTCRKSTIP